MIYEFTLTKYEIEEMLKLSGKESKNLLIRITPTEIADKIEICLQTDKQKQWKDITEYESW